MLMWLSAQPMLLLPMLWLPMLLLTSSWPGVATALSSFVATMHYEGNFESRNRRFDRRVVRK